MAGKPGRKRASGRRSRNPVRTKIVATLGPGSDKATTIRDMIQAGVDVFRLNFSYGSHGEHQRRIRMIRRAAGLEGASVGIMADLQGPKIRVGALEGARPLFLERGDRLDLVADPGLLGRAGRVGCTIEKVPADLRRGDRVLLDDGNIELRVHSVEGRVVGTRVRFGGLLREHKGINLPGTRIQTPCLTEKDLADLDFALEQGVDFVALSFVRRPEDLRRLRERIQARGGDSRIIAKIERPEAVKRIGSIVAHADGIMVARGDMGVELGVEAVPSVQKEIIRLCIREAKPVITATQMLESMVDRPRPTRAEVSDVANAILDGSSALMLSGETAVGKHPILAVRAMGRIARRTEAEIFARGPRHATGLSSGVRPKGSISEATIRAAATAALDVGAKAVVVFTETGRTATLFARERIRTRALAMTPSPGILGRLALQWGIIPMPIPRARSLESLLGLAEDRLLAARHVRPGDAVVYIAGTLQVSGATNSLTIRRVGEGGP